MKKWTIEDSEELYNIKGWGTSYFGINDKGDVYVSPCKDNTQIDLRDIMDELSLRDVTSPVLLRFPDILDNRIEKTFSCFQKARKEYNFQGENFIIYPIKVNQMQPVVEEIISHGRKFNLGLEAGSKPELHAVIAVQCQSDSLIICNGYKDDSYIELALLAQKMGKRIFIVVEKLNELEVIAKAAKKLKVKPNLGMRIKLASSGSGKWEESGGDASKFGLTSAELLEALQKLDDMGMHNCLQLIHFHIGSQIKQLSSISTSTRWVMMCDLWIVAVVWAWIMTEHAPQTARVRSTIPYKNMSTIACIRLLMLRTKTAYNIPISSPKAVEAWLHTILFWW